MPILGSLVYWGRVICLARYPIRPGITRELHLRPDLRPDLRSIVVALSTSFARATVDVPASMSLADAWLEIDLACAELRDRDRAGMAELRRRACGGGSDRR